MEESELDTVKITIGDCARRGFCLRTVRVFCAQNGLEYSEVRHTGITLRQALAIDDEYIRILIKDVLERHRGKFK